MDSRKYNDIILSQVQTWFDRERERGIRLAWQHDGASCHRSFETQDNLYRRNIPTIDWPPYSPDLNLIEHVWSWMKRYIQSRYFEVFYNAQTIQFDRLREIISEAWNAVPDSYIETLYESWWRRCQAVIDARGGPTEYYGGAGGKFCLTAQVAELTGRKIQSGTLRIKFTTEHT